MSSKRRSIIVSVTVQQLSQAEAAQLYGVSEATVSRLLAGYRREGEAAFEPRSRRPHLSHEDPRRGRRADPEPAGRTRRRRSRRRTPHHRLAPRPPPPDHLSVSTIRRRLLDAGLIEPEPKKRPRTSYIRFQADLPNETWQSDFTHWPLADGTDTEILTWLDDHARYALSVTAHRHVTGPLVVATFLDAAAQHGFPASVLTDNALVYTTRFAGYRGGRNHLETTLAGHGITQKHSRPNHPTTCGKVERFQQTLKRWLRKQPPAATITELQALLDAFVELYNHHRPHGSLQRRPPAVVYRLLPTTGPAGTGAGPHHRIRHDRIDKTGALSLRRAGRLHHLSIGRAHAGRPVVLLIDDLDIRVIDTTTAEPLRHLTLDPTRGYQPRHK